ncbi:MAG: formimidoylglutamate deiminase, partial [Paracoccaceae bacterium]
MRILWAKQALTDCGWQQNVRIELAADGRIKRVAADQPAAGMRLGAAIPAPANVHSHAFQRAMAGLAERRGGDGTDSFWTWRRLMYAFLERLTPENVEAIAAYAQMEMLEAGFAAVGEFHYLHNAPGGAHYDDPAEMSARIMAAARQSGIGLTLLPVLYAQGGCDGRPLAGGQMRFGNDVDSFAAIQSGCKRALASLEADCKLGMAPHSLRAVPREMLDHLPELAPDGPIHIHIAEQEAEITDVLAHLGARPVEWLLNILDVDERWCLVHATHMSSAETVGLAASGAVAGLCPITEANLGDGIFDGVRFLKSGGTLAIGSDSNIRISLCEELRLLEYSQRLRERSRVMLAKHGASNGRTLLEAAARGGARAIGRDSGSIAPGKWADIIGLSSDHPDLDGLSGDTLLDTFLFARDERQIAHVWSAGRHLVRNGRHVGHGA